MDTLTNECQQLATEVFAENGAPNNPSTLAAAKLIGEAFAKKIQEREDKQPIGGRDFLSKEYATQQLMRILPGYEVSARGVFEDIFSVLRQDSFLLRSLLMISEQTDLDKIARLQTSLKAVTTWVTAWAQYRKVEKL